MVGSDSRRGASYGAAIPTAHRICIREPCSVRVAWHAPSRSLAPASDLESNVRSGSIAFARGYLERVARSGANPECYRFSRDSLDVRPADA
jgi:hypothetical protein